MLAIETQLLLRPQVRATVTRVTSKGVELKWIDEDCLVHEQTFPRDGFERHAASHGWTALAPKGWS